MSEGNPVKIFETRIIHKNRSVISILFTLELDQEDKLIYCTIKIFQRKTDGKAYEVEKQGFRSIQSVPSCMGILKGPDHIF
jgi:hypothetical protein